MQYLYNIHKLEIFQDFTFFGGGCSFFTSENIFFFPASQCSVSVLVFPGQQGMFTSKQNHFSLIFF